MLKSSTSLILLFSLFLLASCGSNSSTPAENTIDSASIKAQQDSINNLNSTNELISEDALEVTYLDTTIEVMGDFTVSQIRYNDGERDNITNMVKNNKSGVSYELGGEIHKKVGNFFLVGNDGSETTNEQYLRVAKVEDGNGIHDFIYQDEYKIEKDNLIILALVNTREVSDQTKLPNCEEEMKNPSLSFATAEEQIVNLKTGELKHTQKYKCVRVE
ncbi:MAG: hypothetical protein ACOVP1_08210 [Bacteroidia bacterium]